MSRINSNIPVATGQRSNRNMSARSFGSTDFGRLDVLYWSPVVPKDEWSLSCQGLLKGATMPSPTIAKLYYDVRFHFVPLRILTHRPEEGKSNFIWDYFINKLSNTAHPYVTLRNLSGLITETSQYISTDSRVITDVRRLFSQLRLPSALVNATVPFGLTTAMGQSRVYPWPFMAYQRIWWDRYRDKSLIDESLLSTYLPFPLPGPNADTVEKQQTILARWLTPRYVCWPKDYFTNARSKLGTQQNAVLFVTPNGQGSQDTLQTVNPNNIPIDTPAQFATRQELDGLAAQSGGENPGNELTVAAIRMAKLVDNYLQRLNIAGTGLINRIFARFGVRPKEELLNMSQYLGGFRHDFGVGSMLSNVETGSVEAQAVDNAFNYGADGSQAGQSTGSIYCEFGSKGDINFRSDSEYGILMVTGSLVPYTGYYQGLHRSWTHGTQSAIADARASYHTPEFANAGLQPILKQELYGESASSASEWDDIFGFSERYGEYAYQSDSVDGDLILSATRTGMNSLHLFREFAATPSLTATFTMIDPAARESLDRIFNYLKTGDQSETLLDHFQRVIYFEANVNRSLASSMLPDLFEDNNHGNVVSVSVGGDRF